MTLGLSLLGLTLHALQQPSRLRKSERDGSQNNGLVLYVKMNEHYTSNAIYTCVRAAPTKALVSWFRKHGCQFQDSWGWSEEASWNKSSKLFGYVRVLDSKKIQILASSGHDFFFDPSRDAGVPPSTIEWIERLDREVWNILLGARRWTQLILRFC